jgi:beta-lactam-binding protein with PASTA domain
MKHKFWLGVFVLFFGIGPITALAQSSVSDSLQMLGSADPAVRESGFYSLLGPGTDLVGSTIATKLQSLLGANASLADQIKVALNNALSLENVLVAQSNQTLTTSLDEDYTDYYANLISAVSSLNDPRFVTSMIGASKSGGGSLSGLIAMGPAAIGPLVASLNAGDSLRDAALGFALIGMVQRPDFKSAFSASDAANILRGLQIVFAGADAYVQSNVLAAEQQLTGAVPVLVPNVVGLTQSAATAAITAAGLTLGTVTTRSNSSVASGSVISENPIAATSVAPGSAVNLVVSSGPALVPVPNVVGLTQATATSAITGAGLTPGTVTQQTSSTIAAGLVISESPVAGTSVAPNSAVSLVVSSGPAPVTVPNVVGLTQAAATTAITSAGLTVGTVTTQSSATVALGLVVSENPVAGTSVSAKSAVNLVISSGPAAVPVPNVVGLTQAAATNAITSAGLTLGTVTLQSSATVAAGLVISESPVAGTSVAANSAVNLVVSSGPAPVLVPNVVGLTQAAATTTITGAGLTLGTVTQQSSATVAAGLVISESPTAGTSVAAKSTVSLVVSSGPAPVSVPNVVGLTQAAATTAITGAGLTLGTITTQSSSTVAAGLVISEAPTAGTSVAANSAVSLVVSSGAVPVAVPNVVGLTQAAATTAITASGLTLGSVTTQSSATVAAGLVISESPAAGTSVAAKSAVNLVVSSGAAPVLVPNVIGLTQAAAATAITGAGLTLGSVTTQNSSTVAAGLVISENPNAGTRVPSKSAVSLVVSSGAAPVAVPNVVGLTQAAATTAITAAGLTLGSVTQQSSATVAAGLVISETPAAGTSVASKSTVSLVVSSGAAPVAVPNVVGLTQASATAAITAAGLTLGNVTSQNSATVAAGIVLSESPTAGTSVTPKSAVSLLVSSGPAPVSVPNVVGSTQAAATAAITSAGLVVGAVTIQSSPTIAAGIVITESPAAGTSVAAKSAVSLVVSSGSLVGDLNGDGAVNCADLAIIKAAFGKKTGQAGFDPRADINKDGVVNILDLSTEARLMPSGTTCN